MTPRAHRRKLAAAALAVACVIIYLWMLFAWRCRFLAARPSQDDRNITKQ